MTITKSHTIWVPLKVANAPDLRSGMRTGCYLDDDPVDDPIQQGRGVHMALDFSYGLYEVAGTRRREHGPQRWSDVTCLADTLAADAFDQGACLTKGSRSACAMFQRTELDLVPLCAHPFAGVEGSTGDWGYDVPRV